MIFHEHTLQNSTANGCVPLDLTYLSRVGSNVTEKRPRTKRSHTETEAGVEAGPSQSRCMKGYMTNIYLTDSEMEAIVDLFWTTKSCTTRLMNKDRARKDQLTADTCKLRTPA